MEYKVIIGRMLFFFPVVSATGNISPSRVCFLEKGPQACGSNNGFLIDHGRNAVDWYARGTAQLKNLAKEHVVFLARVAKFFGRMEEFHQGKNFWFCIDSTSKDAVTVDIVPGAGNGDKQVRRQTV